VRGVGGVRWGGSAFKRGSYYQDRPPTKLFFASKFDPGKVVLVNSQSISFGQRKRSTQTYREW